MAPSLINVGLGAKTREKKAKQLTSNALRNEWHSRLLPEESDEVQTISECIGGDPVLGNQEMASEAVRHAISHSFERNSVIPERTMQREALRWSLGMAKPDQVLDLLNRQQLVTGERQSRRFVTTREVLAEEMKMIAFARDGRGTWARRQQDDGSTLRRR